MIADGPERAGLRRRDDLEVADAGPAARAPVDERLGPVGQAVAVEPLERDADGPGGPFVHGESQPTPVGGRPDASLLGEDHEACRLHEFAHPLEVALAAETLAALAFLREDPVEHELGGDARVVEAGQEERGVAAHRAWRIIRSSTAVRWAWPRWSEPVTLGGGWMIVKGGRSGSAVEPAPSGAKTSAASQRA